MPLGEFVLRPGPDGAALIPDRAYPRAFTLRVGGTDQSYVDLDDPRRLEFDYIQRIADVVDSVTAPGEHVRAIHVGGAALTLPRYISATRPGSRQVVLEPDADLTEFVRLHLPLPPRTGITVRAIDGLNGLAAVRDGYADLVLVDAFIGAQVPAELTTLDFFADVRRVLTDAGVVVVNVTDRGPLAYARRVMAGVARAFPEVMLCAEPATFKGRRFGNVIIAGGAVSLPYQAIATRTGSGPFPYRMLHGQRVAQLLLGVEPLTGEGEPSPSPPRGLGHFA